MNVSVTIDKMIYHTDSITVEATLSYGAIKKPNKKIWGLHVIRPKGEQTERGLWGFVYSSSNRTIKSEALLNLIGEAIDEYAAA